MGYIEKQKVKRHPNHNTRAIAKMKSILKRDGKSDSEKPLRNQQLRIIEKGRAASRRNKFWQRAREKFVF